MLLFTCLSYKFAYSQPKRYRFYTTDDGLRSSIILSGKFNTTYQDKNGFIWFATFGGVNMRYLVYTLLKAKKIDCSFKPDESLNALKLPVQTRRNFYLIFKEALNDLVKYSQADCASVMLMHENRQVVLVVHDNGIGFDVASKYNGSGLNNIRRRANEINTKLNIESSAEGITVDVNLRV